MSQHGDRLAALVDDMLSISKLESGDASLLDIAEFSLPEVFNDIRDRLLPMTTEHNSSIKVVLPEGDFTMLGDKFYWEQILFNLTENALKQNASQKVKVTLAAVNTEGEISITVSDNGKGIPSIHLPFIFNRFYRVQKHHSQNQVKGTGLGHSIVKHAIEAHKGTISVTSTPGEETVFSINLPKH